MATLLSPPPVAAAVRATTPSARRLAPARQLAPAALWCMAALAAVRLGLHAFTSMRGYGFSSDELYFLDMARHPAWGYVDCAPLVALYARVALALGGSLAAVRLLPALAGAALVVLTMALARELGGGRYAQAMTGLCATICPAFVIMDGYLSMNAFEPLYWTGALLVLARVLRTGRERLWPWFGLLAGLGLENKHSTLFFGFALAVALLLTRRRIFLRRWPWIAAAVAMAIFLPNLGWQIQHHFPTLTCLENVRREGKNVVLGPLAFLREQIVDLSPFYFPVWLTGMVWLLRRAGWRALGVAFVVFFATMELLHGKNYYLFPMYPMLFAAAGVALEAASRRHRGWRLAVPVALAFGGLVALPLALPLLPPVQFLAYERAIRILPRESESGDSGALPRAFGEQFGWPELAQEVAGLYAALPAVERADTGILVANYGEAGAIDEFGPALGLPRAYSGHQNYWYWGPPKPAYKNLIVLRWSRAQVEAQCTHWQEAAHAARFGVAAENAPIYYCEGVRFDLTAAWPQLKHWN